MYSGCSRSIYIKGVWAYAQTPYWYSILFVVNGGVYAPPKKSGKPGLCSAGFPPIDKKTPVKLLVAAFEEIDGFQFFLHGSFFFVCHVLERSTVGAEIEAD